MNKLTDIEIRLWEYMDGLGDASERAAVEELIQTHTEWRAKYAELLELNEMLQLTELEAPSMRFTKNVMEEIAHHHIAPATSSYINQRVIWGLSAFFITLIAGFIVYAFRHIRFEPWR
jgi:anti-sigma factor RsiW